MSRSTTVPACFLLLALSVVFTRTSGGLSTFPRRGHATPMHKVQLTQRGYIQFLRWELPVPEIKEFTFCLWLRSDNLTYSHPIFSYSKDERDRLIRAWISPGGRSVHLEIEDREVFGTAVDIREDRWYHLCQSWENQVGRYALWIDGQLRVQGQSEETRGRVIRSGGDIVVGQEYTDFDKGLEDGIEGAVLGFNLLLASSFIPVRSIHQEADGDSAPQPSVSNYIRVPFPARRPPAVAQQDAARRKDRRLLAMAHELLRGTSTLDPSGHEYLIRSVRMHRAKRFSDSSLPAALPTEILRTAPLIRGAYLKSREDVGLRSKANVGLRSGKDDDSRSREKVYLRSTRKILDMSSVQYYPLGLQLVELTYVFCELGRGSPLIGGRLMLISWTRTPVRIFGGATVKNVRSDCGNF